MTSNVDPLFPVDDGLPKSTQTFRDQFNATYLEITALQANTGLGAFVDSGSTQVVDNGDGTFSIAVTAALGEVNTLADVNPAAGGESIVGTQTGTVLRVKRDVAGSGMTLVSDAETRTWSTSVVPGEANTASNIGAFAANGLFAGKVGLDLTMKGVSSTDGSVTLTPSADTLDLSVAGAYAAADEPYVVVGAPPAGLTGAVQLAAGAGLGLTNATIDYDIGALPENTDIDEDADHLLFDDVSAGARRRIKAADLSAKMRPRIIEQTISGNVSLDLSAGTYFVYTLSGDAAITGWLNRPVFGIAAPIFLQIKQPVGANYDFDFTVMGVSWVGGTPAVTRTNGAIDFFSIMLQGNLGPDYGFRAGPGALTP